MGSFASTVVLVKGQRAGRHNKRAAEVREKVGHSLRRWRSAVALRCLACSYLAVTAGMTRWAKSRSVSKSFSRIVEMKYCIPALTKLW
jgi:hypothetical protein